MEKQNTLIKQNVKRKQPKPQKEFPSGVFANI